MSTLAELKQRLEAARVERERREKETREQEERELQRLVEEERREEEQVAEGQRNATDVGGEGSMETGDTAGVTETAGESWETDIARLHVAAMAGGYKDDGEDYQATEDTCWNCRHRKLVCDVLSKFFFSLISLADCFAGQGGRAVGA